MAEDRETAQAKRGVSRRGFLVGAGTGAAAAAAVGSGLVGLRAAEAQPVPQVDPELGLATVRMRVNGVAQAVNVESRWTLLEVLRDKLGYTGTKLGCDRAECGACTVVMNGAAVYSCSQLALWADGAEISTVEGLARGDELHPIQQAFWDNHGLQCGFCTPGMLIAAYELLQRNSHPTETQVRQAISGNVCRCTGYVNIVKSVMAAASVMAGEGAR